MAAWIPTRPAERCRKVRARAMRCAKQVRNWRFSDGKNGALLSKRQTTLEGDDDQWKMVTMDSLRK